MPVDVQCTVCGHQHQIPPSRLLAYRCCSAACRVKLVAKHKTRHGMYGTRLYRIWNNMHSRCRCSSTVDYDLYGGAGITVCGEWQAFDGFHEWARDTGYQDGMSLDRKIAEHGYSPENCRWATASQQCMNRRKERKPKSTSVYKGVRYEATRTISGKWLAQGKANGQYKRIGWFDTEVEAAQAYDAWAAVAMGEFARPNFPLESSIATARQSS
jgi:hypothetical protein